MIIYNFDTIPILIQDVFPITITLVLFLCIFIPHSSTMRFQIFRLYFRFQIFQILPVILLLFGNFSTSFSTFLMCSFLFFTITESIKVLKWIRLELPPCVKPWYFVKLSDHTQYFWGFHGRRSPAVGNSPGSSNQFTSPCKHFVIHSWRHLQWRMYGVCVDTDSMFLSTVLSYCFDVSSLLMYLYRVIFVYYTLYRKFLNKSRVVYFCNVRIRQFPDKSLYLIFNSCSPLLRYC